MQPTAVFHRRFESYLWQQTRQSQSITSHRNLFGVTSQSMHVFPHFSPFVWDLHWYASPHRGIVSKAPGQGSRCPCSGDGWLVGSPLIGTVLSQYVSVPVNLLGLPRRFKTGGEGFAQGEFLSKTNRSIKRGGVKYTAIRNVEMQNRLRLKMTKPTIIWFLDAARLPSCCPMWNAASQRGSSLILWCVSFGYRGQISKRQRAACECHLCVVDEKLPTKNHRDSGQKVGLMWWWCCFALDCPDWISAGKEGSGGGVVWLHCRCGSTLFAHM